MEKIYTFNVCISGLENKIWRKIEMPVRFTVADLAYTILASFNSLAYHLYNVRYDNETYHCMIDSLDIIDDKKIFKDAVMTRLSELDFSKNSKMIMDYDFGSTTTFEITYLETKEIDNFDICYYPYVIDGKGNGMLDDISDMELKEIVLDTDKLGHSEHYYTMGYNRDDIFDYRKYDKDFDNGRLKGLILTIKNGYEVHKK